MATAAVKQMRAINEKAAAQVRELHGEDVQELLFNWHGKTLVLDVRLVKAGAPWWVRYQYVPDDDLETAEVGALA